MRLDRSRMRLARPRLCRGQPSLRDVAIELCVGKESFCTIAFDCADTAIAANSYDTSEEPRNAG
jgi:hypothetical protein